jgi:predicted nuclease with TOPRIM domain
MSFLNNSKEMKGKFDSLTKELSDLSAENISLRNKLDDSMSIMETFDAEKKAIHKKNAEYKKEIEALKNSNKQNIETVSLSVNRKINEFLATIGVTEFAAESFTNNSSVNDEQVYNKFQSLSGNERTEFYNKNKAQITRVLLKQ